MKAQIGSRGITLLLPGPRRGQRHAPAIPTGRSRYPLNRKLGGLHSRSGWRRKISLPPGFDLRTVQPVTSRYTDYAIPALIQCIPGVFDQGVGVWSCQWRATNSELEMRGVIRKTTPAYDFLACRVTTYFYFDTTLFLLATGLIVTSSCALTGRQMSSTFI
jgi:hypothetical protein